LIQQAKSDSHFFKFIVLIFVNKHLFNMTASCTSLHIISINRVSNGTLFIALFNICEVLAKTSIDLSGKYMTIELYKHVGNEVSVLAIV